MKRSLRFLCATVVFGSCSLTMAASTAAQSPRLQMGLSCENRIEGTNFYITVERKDQLSAQEEGQNILSKEFAQRLQTSDKVNDTHAFIAQVSSDEDAYPAVFNNSFPGKFDLSWKDNAGNQKTGKLVVHLERIPNQQQWNYNPRGTLTVDGVEHALGCRVHTSGGPVDDDGNLLYIR